MEVGQKAVVIEEAGGHPYKIWQIVVCGSLERHSPIHNFNSLDGDEREAMAPSRYITIGDRVKSTYATKATGTVKNISETGIIYVVYDDGATSHNDPKHSDFHLTKLPPEPEEEVGETQIFKKGMEVEITGDTSPHPKHGHHHYDIGRTVTLKFKHRTKDGIWDCGVYYVHEQDMKPITSTKPEAQHAVDAAIYAIYAAQTREALMYGQSVTKMIYKEDTMATSRAQRAKDILEITIPDLEGKVEDIEAEIKDLKEDAVNLKKYKSDQQAQDALMSELLGPKKAKTVKALQKAGVVVNVTAN